MRDAQLEPSAVAALLGDGLFDVAVRFEGFPAGVAEQRDRLLALVTRTPGHVCDALSDADARAFWERHDAARTAGPLRAKAAMLPSAFEEFFERVFPTLRDVVSGAALAVYPTLGISFFSGFPSDAAAAAAAITSARSSVASSGGSLVLEEAPDAVRAFADPWGPPPSSFALMRSLKERLDPGARLNPGRFVGGI
jgi:glycolate oxidase FAD binding subunit